MATHERRLEDICTTCARFVNVIVPQALGSVDLETQAGQWRQWTWRAVAGGSADATRWRQLWACCVSSAARSTMRRHGPSGDGCGPSWYKHSCSLCRSICHLGVTLRGCLARPWIVTNVHNICLRIPKWCHAKRKDASGLPGSKLRGIHTKSGGPRTTSSPRQWTRCGQYVTKAYEGTSHEITNQNSSRVIRLS